MIANSIIKIKITIVLCENDLFNYPDDDDDDEEEEGFISTSCKFTLISVLI